MLNIKQNEYFDVITMPGGEPHMKWKSGNLDGLNIKLLARLNSGNDLLELLVVTDALKRLGCRLSVCIPYFCGARQDRISGYGESLTVKVYADIINAQGYTRVSILDPHSDVTPALINNCSVLPVSHILKKIVTEGNYNVVLIPDAGAAKKTLNYYFPDSNFNQKLTFVQCLKKRDTVTGKLSGFKVVDPIPEYAKCLIVDDICDGGGTFLGLAEEAINGPSGTVDKLSLYVTHGIFSKGVESLLYPAKYGFNEIYTTDSIRPNQPEGVKVFKL